MSWLDVWDEALTKAVRDGEPGQLWKWNREAAVFVLVARTRHPAFMGSAPVKHDPERDNG